MPNVKKAKFTIKAQNQSFTGNGYKFVYVYKYYMTHDTEPAYSLSTVEHAAGSINTTENLAESSYFYRNCTAKAMTYLVPNADYNDVDDVSELGIASSVAVSTVANIEGPDGPIAFTYDLSQGDLSAWRRRSSNTELYNFLNAVRDWDITFDDGNGNEYEDMELTIDSMHGNTDVCITYEGNVAGNIRMIVSPKSGMGSHFTETTPTITIESLVINAPVITIG